MQNNTIHLKQLILIEPRTKLILYQHVFILHIIIICVFSLRFKTTIVKFDFYLVNYE